MADDLPDEILMQRIARNDTAAFDVLFRRHRRAIFSFTLRMVGDGPAAEDLTQECFLRVWRARERYQPAASFRTWLFTIARRLALDELKRRAALRSFLPRMPPRTRTPAERPQRAREGIRRTRRRSSSPASWHECWTGR